MAITFSCSCGKSLQVKDEYGGKRVRCPACSDAITVPQPEPQFEVVEDEPVAPPARVRAAPVRAKAMPTSRDDDDEDRDRKRRRDDDEDDDDRPRSKRGQYDVQDEEEPPRKKRSFKPKKKKRAKKEETQQSNYALEKGILNGGVAGGALAMVIAIIWFVVGLMNDWIFFYPPILFILGLIAFIKGLMGGDE
jgi:hypothetical protein